MSGVVACLDRIDSLILGLGGHAGLNMGITLYPYGAPQWLKAWEGFGSTGPTS